jgi:hypothetical protein
MPASAVVPTRGGNIVVLPTPDHLKRLRRSGQNFNVVSTSAK